MMKWGGKQEEVWKVGVGQCEGVMENEESVKENVVEQGGRVKIGVVEQGWGDGYGDGWEGLYEKVLVWE